METAGLVVHLDLRWTWTWTLDLDTRGLAFFFLQIETKHAKLFHMGTSMALNMCSFLHTLFKSRYSIHIQVKQFVLNFHQTPFTDLE